MDLPILPTKPGIYGFVIFDQCGCCIDAFGAFFVFNDPDFRYKNAKRHYHVGDLCYHWEAGDEPYFYNGAPRIDKIFPLDFIYDEVENETVS